MNFQTPALSAPFADDPGRRLLWTVPLAVLIWIALLVGFSQLVEQGNPPPAEPTSVEARIVVLPPETAGLQGGAAPAQPAARPTPAPHPVRHPRVKAKAMVPLRPPEPAGTASPAQTAPASPGPPAQRTGGISGGTGTGAGAGLGSDTTGARAIYAPVPKIPDDLREENLDAVAVVHFKVKYDGSVEMVLSQPTANPEINRLLIDTLMQWRFFPAVRQGVAIDSEFDLRIPITVQ